MVLTITIDCNCVQSHHEDPLCLMVQDQKLSDKGFEEKLNGLSLL